MGSSNPTEQDHKGEIHLNIPAEFQFLSVVNAAIAAMLDQEQSSSSQEMLTYQVQLAVHETCTNIIEHACAGEGGRIEAVITLDETQCQLIIDLYDTGNGFILSEFTPPNLNEPNTSGYGLFIIHELMDSVCYHPESGRNHWRLIKRLV
jgi:serine/threonine-protein kinase RsbW